MKDHSFYSQQPSGQIIMCWYDDARRAQVMEQPQEDGRYNAFQVTRLMKLAYNAGKDFKREEVLNALGLKDL